MLFQVTMLDTVDMKEVCIKFPYAGYLDTFITHYSTPSALHIATKKMFIIAIQRGNTS